MTPAPAHGASGEAGLGPLTVDIAGRASGQVAALGQLGSADDVQHHGHEEDGSLDPQEPDTAQDGFPDGAQPGGVGIEVVWAEEDLEVSQHVQQQEQHMTNPVTAMIAFLPMVDCHRVVVVLTGSGADFDCCHEGTVRLVLQRSKRC